MGQPAHLRENRWLALDYRLGLRGAGLILYGALPASLGALGALKAPEQGALQFGGLGIIFVVLVALIPVSVTFLLTRQRLGSWYLLADDLNLRSFLITVEIVIASTLVCIATRALSKPDIQRAVAEWWALPFWAHSNAIGHAVLLAVAYLVASSTLFLTVIKEDSGLPLLPKKDVLANETELRKQLAFTVAAAKDWPAGIIDGQNLAERTDELHTHIADANKAIISLQQSAPTLGRRAFYGKLSEELEALRQATNEAKGSHADASNKYWGTPEHELNNDFEVPRRNRVRWHAELCIHA